MPEPVNPITKQLTEQLRDVHLPEGVSWWPLAFGWWLLIFCVVSLVLVLGFFAVRQWRSNQYRKSAQAELNSAYILWQENGVASDYLNSANRIFKRIMQRLNQHSAVSSSGVAWVQSLNQMVTSPLSETTQNALAYECYRAIPSVDIEVLNKDLMNWINFHNLSTKISDEPSSTHEGTLHA